MSQLRTQKWGKASSREDQIATSVKADSRTRKRRRRDGSHASEIAAPGTAPAGFEDGRYAPVEDPDARSEVPT